MEKFRRNLSSKSFINRANMFFGDLLNATYDCIWLVDKTTKLIVYANNACARRYGYSQEDFIGMPISSINLLGETAIRKAMQQIEANPTHVHTFEAVHRLSNKDIIDVEVVSKLTTFNGREYYLSRISDISGQLRIQNNLQLWREIIDTNGYCSVEGIYRTLLDKFKGCKLGLISVDISMLNRIDERCGGIYKNFVRSKVEQLIYSIVDKIGYILYVEENRLLIALPAYGDDEAQQIKTCIEQALASTYFEHNKQVFCFMACVKMVTGTLENQYVISSLIKEVV